MSDYKGLSSGIFISGVTAIIAGAVNPNASWALWLTSLGSAAVGATIGSFFLRLSAKDILQHVKHVLTKTANARFISDVEFTDAYKKKWYHYNVSQNNRKLTWKCAHLDYRSSPVEGGLSAVIHFEDKVGKIHKYRVESAFRGERLISFYHAPAGLESVAVEIIPFMGHAFKDYYSGIAFMQTWDGTHSLIPILISEKPLFDVKAEGHIPDEKNELFDNAWIAGMDCIDSVFPLPSKQRGVDLNNIISNT